MSNGNERTIKTINKGRLDIYVSLKFETKLSFIKLCDKIQKGIDLDIDDHFMNIRESFQDIRNKKNQEIRIKYNRKISLKQKVCYSIRHKKHKKNKETSQNNDGTTIELRPTEKGIQLDFKPGEMLSYDKRREELESEFEQQVDIYDSTYINSHMRFVLLPLYVQLNNDEFVWLNAILFVFKNKTGVLKLEIPMVNISTKPFMENKIDSLIKKVNDKFCLFDLGQNLSINTIVSAYIKRISTIPKVNIIQKRFFQNIICTEFDGMPKDINNIPCDIQEDLFRIIAAPVPNRKGASYKKISSEFLSKQSWGTPNIKYITSPTGKCLSIIDFALVDFVKEKYKKDLGLQEIDEESIVLIHEQLVTTLCVNAEFAILLLLLKHMNSTYSYGMKILNPKNVHKVQRMYYLNLMFIADLQMNCYGTVSEQISAFENMMPYYLQEKILASKMEAIDHILSDEESQRNSLFQNLLSWGSLGLALFFGLPAINDTITIIRKFSFFTSADTPFVSIKGISVAIWIVLIVLLLFYSIKYNCNNAKKQMKF